MPRVMQMITADPTITVAYTVDAAVGMGGQNRREDVLLVQHLLRVAWEDTPQSKGFRPPGETAPLQVDGNWGPVSQRFLKFFQEEAKRRGANVLLDQRIDPAASGTATSSNSHTFYTTLALNSARNSRRPKQADIKSDVGFPSELKRWFYIDFGA